MRESKKKSASQNKREFLPNPKTCANYHECLGKTPKTNGLYYKIYKKTVLAHEFWGDSFMIPSILGVSGVELHFSSTKPVNFCGAQSSLAGHNSRLGGHGPRIPLVALGLIVMSSQTAT